jgi:DNA-binding CsgD family transcriptional regulator
MTANRERLRLYGREAECRRLAQLVDGVRGGSSAALVICGKPGTGRTALLDFTAELAAGLRVVRATGAESEAELAFAGLHRLCGPLLDLLGRLPSPQREALEVAFGIRAGAGPDRFLVGLAVLGLLAEAAADRPLACVIDDAQWLDPPSRQALGFAARRLAAPPLLLVFATPKPITDLTGLPVMALGGLRDADACDLLASVVRWPVDDRVRDQMLAEAKGIPGALLGLMRQVSPAQLAGGFGLPAVMPDGTAGPLLAELGELPPDTRQLLLLAAADPTGDPVLLWRAAAHLAVSPSAALPAAEAGLITFDGRVVFRDHTVRSTAYQAARLPERQAAHLALGKATHPGTDPDRRAWHQAKALTELNEDVAAELERTTARARARGGLAAAAAFLERAAVATPDPARRTARSLTAASVMLAAGEPGAAAKLLDLVEADTLDAPRQAQADLVRARLTLTAGRSNNSPLLMLEAGRKLSRFDGAQARAAYLDAIRAALSAGHQAAAGATAADVARAARETWPDPDSPGPAAALAAGLAASLGGDLTAGAPLLRQAVDGVRDELTTTTELTLLPLACAAALQLWDDQAGDTFGHRYVELARSAGALTELPAALNTLGVLRLLSGDLAGADWLAGEARAVAIAAGVRTAPYSALGLAALRGRADPARALIDSTRREAGQRSEGLGVAAANWAAAVLYNGLGRYAEALSAAEDAVEQAGPPVIAGWAMGELIEAATRSGQTGRATEVMRALADVTAAAGTDWALGVRARSLALLSDGPAAEDQYQAAIRHLGRSRARVDLARAHLLYGEWLRRERRHSNAREQLHQAEAMLEAMGADGFTERARRELLADGETVRKRGAGADRDLTPQERQVAVRARDGKTNNEIGAELFLSARTVEWHLRKVFAKLDITSRRQISGTLPAATRSGRRTSA